MEQGIEAAGDAYATWTYVAKGDGGLTRCATACAGDDKCRAFVVRSDAELAPAPGHVRTEGCARRCCATRTPSPA